MSALDPAEPLLDKYSDDVRRLVQQLRILMAEVMPRVPESVNIGWAAINYCSSSNMRDFIASLNPQRTYVNVEFRDGVDLPDPAGLLEGTGKRLRHVKVRTAEDVQKPALRNLLVAAAKLRGQ